MEKEIRLWRLSSADPAGCNVWFDPTTELLTLRDLTEDEKLVTLDKLGSVSALAQFDHVGEIDGCELVSGPLARVLRQLDMFSEEVEDGPR